MPRTAAPRGADQLSEAVEFQLLWHRVRVEVPDAETADAVRLVSQRADHPWTPVAEVDLAVRAAGAGRYSILDRGDLLATVDGSRQVLDAVFERVHRRAFELASLRGWVRFHGAVIAIDGRRLALSGPSGSGKTTLAAAALLAGGTVEGDESFLARDGQVVAVPRRWHLRSSSVAHLPAASWLTQAPILAGDPPLHLVDPTDHGFGWTLAQGPLAAVVLLDDPAARPGGGPGRRPVEGTEVVRHLLNESFPVVESRRTVVAQASALALAAPAVAVSRGATPPIDLIRFIAHPDPAD